MPQKRGTILTRRQVKLSTDWRASPSQRKAPTKFVGKLQPFGGGDPITYTSRIRVNKNDKVLYTGAKRATVVKAESMATTNV